MKGMQVKAILSLSKTLVQSKARCVYAKSDVLVNGLTMMWLYECQNHREWSEWSKWSLTSLKGEERGPRQGQSNEMWQSKLIGGPKVKSFASKWSSNHSMLLLSRVWSKQRLPRTKVSSSTKETREGLNKGEEWGEKKKGMKWEKWELSLGKTQ